MPMEPKAIFSDLSSEDATFYGDQIAGVLRGHEFLYFKIVLYADIESAKVFAFFFLVPENSRHFAIDRFLYRFFSKLKRMRGSFNVQDLNSPEGWGRMRIEKKSLIIFYEGDDDCACPKYEDDFLNKIDLKKLSKLFGVKSVILE